MAPSLLEPQASPHPASTVCTQTPLKPWTKGLRLTSVITSPLFQIWLLFPQRLRLMACRGLKRFDEYLYGVTTGSNSVQKLPFGLFLKYSDDFERSENELNALRTVRRCTTIPVPKGLDLVSLVVESSDDWGNATTTRQPYLLMTTLPGAPLSQCIDAIFDEDYQNIRQQLQEAV
ncbi:Protein kinase-like domain protein [Akanthomyces lecanii RCEF 1005]|uniref:Protein kinase-like domain protein n=1 Tax=Akanthomyces lecanii RCEF 1005 TaxID=1081108 RepID=A0A168IXW7_CORDF|nr:Protein kinase-like domain protein [Akanthomyces lecanii RCEF 1005]